MTAVNGLRLLLGVILLACTSCAFAKLKKPSEEMILILIHHKSGDHDLDPKGLNDDKAMHFPTKAELAEYELYEVPYPKGTADYFAYTVYLHTKSGRYWIGISGGVGGVNRFLGPGTVAALKP